MNTNAIHNALNTAIVITGVWAGFDFSVFGLSATFAGKLTAAFALSKLTMNAVRDGLAGMVKDQPPVR